MTGPRIGRKFARAVLLLGVPLAAVAAALGISPGDATSRARPADKAALVAALKSRGDVVAMVGDGISDEEAAAANGCTFFVIRAPEDLMRVGQSLEEHHV